MSLYAADSRVKLRRAQSLTMLTLCSLGALVGIAVLGLVLYFLAVRGLSHLNLTLFTVASGDGDGFAQSVRGTLQILGVACTIAVPIGILGGIYQQESKGKFAHTVRFLTDVLNGIPSIVIGIFVYAALVLPISQAYPGKGYSGWAGGVALAIMMLPLIMRTTEEMLRLVPSALAEASLGLGATRWRTMLSVVLPAARGGILTGMLLAVARVAGETAPLIFTILGNEFMGKMDGQVDALPLRLFKYATDVDEKHNQIAWAAALTLIMMVLLMSIVARLATRSRVQEDK
ncbi:phosphate ABC transporter permease PstA [Armatimonas sp.]|uniref:phosphate ABC transporter permease PstA n=1 Tax=Armatimonas sp. TaxID=1872638 RepID=UPI0037505507